MDLITGEDPKRIKRLVAQYNMIPNLFWSALNLIPISIFCYTLMSLKCFITFLVASFLSVFLPISFFDRIQLGKTSVIYRKIGVKLVNKFTQNGDIINGLIRKRMPGYKVISKRNVGVNKLLKQTYMFEKFHFAMFLFFTLAAIYAFIHSNLAWGFIILLTNLVYNIYPNLLQQYTRVRLKSAFKIAT